MDYTNGIIYLMRGDSYSQPIEINLGTKFNPALYNLVEGDALYFGLMHPNQAFEDAVLKKKYDYLSDTDENGNIMLTIEPEDTLELPVGKYFYMIKLKRMSLGKAIVTTVVNPTQFFLQGNNKCDNSDVYYTRDDYVITDLILNGGEIAYDEIIWDGGEIT